MNEVKFASLNHVQFSLDIEKPTTGLVLPSGITFYGPVHVSFCCVVLLIVRFYKKTQSLATYQGFGRSNAFGVSHIACGVVIYLFSGEGEKHGIHTVPMWKD